MEYFYIGLFLALVLVTVTLEAQHSNACTPDNEALKSLPALSAFKTNYLIVYSLAMAGDWLQGPYIYALYEHYGYKVGDIGRFFIAGFGSSMLFGTIVGALADTYGRKRASLLYMLTYSASCLTKHSGSFWVLMLGRVLGGIATSLLFSAFESWLVAEHMRRGFPEGVLGDIFSKAVFCGAGLMAIVSGLAGNVLVETLRMGPVAPFDAAVVVMLVGAGVIAWSWPENYGDNAHTSLWAQLHHGWMAIRTDQRVALLGAMQSLFEASMYTFVFLWTPALSPRGEKIPHGMVFSCFMTACMAGSALTGNLVKRFVPQQYMTYVYALSAASMMVPFVFHLEHRDADVGSSLHGSGIGGMSGAGRVQLLAFCMFEACIGIFWPSMMSLRAHYVPEEMRSTIINIFRVPLNLFVCVVLYKVSAFPLSVMFGVCVVFLCIALLCQLKLNAITADEDNDSKHKPPERAKQHKHQQPPQQQLQHQRQSDSPKASLGGVGVGVGGGSGTSSARAAPRLQQAIGGGAI